MRIVHFSDIHVNCLSRDPGACCDKRLLGTLNFLIRRRCQYHRRYLERAMLRIRTLAPDWVILTGDLTCVGSPEEFQTALRELAPLHAARAAFQVLYVPGNHDAYVRNPACRAALEDAFDRLNRGRWRLAELPAAIDLARGLRLFAVDEALPTPIWCSGGEISAATRERLSALLDAPRPEGEKRIVAGHFPLRGPTGRRIGRRRGLTGGEFLWQALQDGKFDISLCGHHHPPFLREEANGAREICAGALTFFGKLNVLDYSPLTGRFHQFWEDVTAEGPQLIPAVPGAAFAPAGVRG
jgi:3',5'-cyclic AMP phosphodiesterase CpdA